MLRLKPLLAALLAVVATACDSQEPRPNPSLFGGDSRHGARLIATFGCGACHSIPGVRDARGLVGPPLDNVGSRTIIAGLLPNTPENLLTWLKAPQSVVPGNAMPNMGLSDHDARDVAAYLYTLR
ncbi:MAG: c-type cytochrome [Alphaproteobacteria bacterium]|nr:c-type cytochrome [Alphaproteobacteria bacterium]